MSLLRTSDPKLNYTFNNGNPKKLLVGDLLYPDGDNKRKVIVEGKNFNYGLTKEPKKSEVSFMNIKNEQQAEEFYRKKNPNYPDYFYSVLAKYHFPDKDIEKDEKKKKKSKEEGFKITKGSFLITW
tara:strand:+ start:11191 stop:11568 length:378 start_codon:yes stop_codon:yes gene_type:complete